MTERELQKLFQKKFAEREVPYNPDAWSAMESMLDKAATPWYARASVLTKSAAALAVVAVSLVTYLNWPTNSLEESISTPVQEVNSSTDIQSESPAAPFEKIKESEQADVEASEPAAHQSVASESSQKSSIQEAPDNQSASSYTSSDKTVSSSTSVLTNKTGQKQNADLAQTSSRNNSTISGDKMISTSLGNQQISKNFSKLGNKQIPNADQILSVSSTEYPSIIYRYEEEQDDIRIEPLAGPSNKSLRSDFSWSISAVFGLGDALSNTENNGAGLASWGLGTNLIWAASPVWTIESGMQYSKRSNLEMQRLFEGVVYSYGADREELEVTATSADFIEIPLLIGYRLSEKHRIKMGYYGAYLFNLSNTVEYRSKGMYDDQWSVSSRNANGYEDGFVQFDHGLLLSYEWAFQNKWTFGLDYQYGLQDLSRDELYLDTRQHYNRQLRFRISYFLK
jgi:hypothetical protein